MTLIPYGFAKLFKRGLTITMILTYRCNLDCHYCTNKMPTGKRPDVKDSNLQELKDFIINFPYKLREVHISGGSPELHPDFAEFVNWLLDRGLFVKIFTNLKKGTELIKLKTTHRLMLVATYHHSDNFKDFDFVYRQLKNVYRIVLEEINDGQPQYFLNSHVKELETNEILKKDNKMLRVSPDLKIYTTCFNLFNQ